MNELRFLRAIIKQAVVDLYGDNFKEKLSAHKFIFEDNHMFSWCCDHLCVDPTCFRETVRRETARRRLTHTGNM